MKPEEMSDEEFGRAWAKQQGKCPRAKRDGWYWWAFDSLEPHSVPFFLGRFLFVSSGSMKSHHESPEDAYAALGRTVRAVHAAVPQLATEQA